MKKLEEKIASLSPEEQEKFNDVIQKCRNRQIDITENRKNLENSVSKIKKQNSEFNQSIERFQTAFSKLMATASSNNINPASVIPEETVEEFQNSVKPFITH